MRKVLVLLGALALLMGACKGPARSQAASTSLAPTTTVAAPTGGGLSTKMLVASDLPPGFKRTKLDVDKPDNTPLGCAPVDNADNQYRSSILHTVDASFQNGEDATATQFVDENVNSYASADVAKQYFDAETTGIAACKTFNQTDTDGTRTSGQLSPYPFPLIADGSDAASLSGTVVNPDRTSASVGGTIVMLRAGKLIVQFTVLHRGQSPGLTGNDVIAIAHKSIARLG